MNKDEVCRLVDEGWPNDRRTRTGGEFNPFVYKEKKYQCTKKIDIDDKELYVYGSIAAPEIIKKAYEFLRACNLEKYTTQIRIVYE